MPSNSNWISGIRWDAQGRPYREFLLSGSWGQAGERQYVPPIEAATSTAYERQGYSQEEIARLRAYGEANRRPGQSLLKNAGTWDASTGEWERGVNWTNIASIGVGGLIAAPVVAGAAGAGAAGAGAGGGGTVLASSAIPGVGASAIPSAVLPTVAGGASAAGAGAAAAGAGAGAATAAPAAAGATATAGGAPGWLMPALRAGSFAATLWGGKRASDAAKEAARIQQEGAARAEGRLDTELQRFEQAYRPYADASARAIQQLSGSILARGGGAPAGGYQVDQPMPIQQAAGRYAVPRAGGVASAPPSGMSINAGVRQAQGQLVRVIAPTGETAMLPPDAAQQAVQRGARVA